MIYLFRKFNGLITMATGAAAWELYASDGQWKHRARYLGAIPEQLYREKKAAVEAKVPIAPSLIRAVNNNDQSKDAPLRSATKKRVELEKALMDELVAAADLSVKPRNMSVVNRDALQAHEQKAVDKLLADI